MAEMVRCKPCGYVTRKDKLRRVCPVCGAKLSAFEPYSDDVSARRRFILNLDLHPILVHAPQTFAVLLPALMVAMWFFPDFYPGELKTVACFSALVLPLGVVGSILSGLIDGRVKFKRLSPPLLRLKIALGAGMLAVTTVNAAVVLSGGYTPATEPWVFGLAAASLVLAVLLGANGKKLIAPIVAGR